MIRRVLKKLDNIEVESEDFYQAILSSLDLKDIRVAETKLKESICSVKDALVGRPTDWKYYAEVIEFRYFQGGYKFLINIFGHAVAHPQKLFFLGEYRNSKMLEDQFNRNFFKGPSISLYDEGVYLAKFWSVPVDGILYPALANGDQELMFKSKRLAYEYLRDIGVKVEKPKSYLWNKNKKWWRDIP
jgi:hypothetical protein